MATAPRRVGGWARVALAVLAAVILVVGFIALAGALASTDHSVVFAQVMRPDRGAEDRPRLVVVGVGRAAAPAETATLQLLIGPSDTGGYMGGSPTLPTPGASPGAEERALAAPVVEALVGAGADEAEIRVIVSAAIPDFAYSTTRFGTRLDLTVERPTPERLNRLIDAAGQALIEGGMELFAVGVAYAVADCAALTETARAAATADAETRAREQAATLGVGLGDLLEAGDAATERSVPTAVGCGTTPVVEPDPFGRSAGAVTLPPFDPTAPTEAVAVAQVRLAYELLQPEGEA